MFKKARFNQIARNIKEIKIRTIPTPTQAKEICSPKVNRGKFLSLLETKLTKLLIFLLKSANCWLMPIFNSISLEDTKPN